MIKYRLRRKWNKQILLLLFCILLVLSGHAQKYTLTFNNTTLSNALIETSKQLGVKVAFDAKKLSQVPLKKVVSGNSNTEVIENLLANSGFDYQFKYGHYLIVEKTANDTPVIKECQFTGAILDKESGEQLPFASISLVHSNQNVSASPNGTFSIRNIVDNPFRIAIRFIGYQPIDTSISWDEPKINLVLKLTRKSQVIDSVVVKASRMEMVEFRNNVDFATTLNPSKLIDLPMLAETDVFKALQLLPGISYTENSSELSIRGGSSDQNLVLYDGQTLYNLSHYYGVFSSVNPNVIKDIQVFKGGYDSRYGERVSGIVDITGKSGNRKKASVYGDINLLSGNLTTEVPIGEKLTLVAAGRRSYSDIYATEFAKGLFRTNTDAIKLGPGDKITESTPAFFFYDYNTKLTFRPNSKENISLSLYGGKDDVDNSYGFNQNALLINNFDKNKWGNYGISADWQRQWSSGFFSDLQLGTSGYDNNFTSLICIDASQAIGLKPKYLPNDLNFFQGNESNQLKDYSLVLRNVCNFTSQNQLEWGFSVRQNRINFHKDADTVYVYNQYSQKATLYSAYSQDRIMVSEKLTIKPGVRFNYYQGNRTMYVEPRFALNYQINDHFSTRAATGRYYQFISEVSSLQESSYSHKFWTLADDSSHAVLASNHYIAGLNFEYGNFQFDAETYYKSFSGIQQYLFISPFLRDGNFKDYFKKNMPGNTSLPPPSKFLTGTGRAYGIDMMLRYKNRFYTGWISYSISKSRQKFSDLNNGEETPSPNDKTHQLSWTNMIALKNWNFGFVTYYSTGQTYVKATQNEKNMPTLYTFSRLPDYFRSDLSANYNFILGKLRLKIGGTIINLFNTKNYFDVMTHKFDLDNASFSQTNLIRSQDLSFNVFLHFAL